MSARYFEDFIIGDIINHATPRTITEGDVAQAHAFYGDRHALTSATPFAKALGYRARPIDDVLVFNLVFGKSVPDISYHAIANLGYGEGVFVAPVFCGDSLHARSEVLGLRENKNGTSGIVMVRTQGFNQNNECVLHYVRWVMVHKRTPSSPAENSGSLPTLAAFVAPEDLVAPIADFSKTDIIASGSARGFDDYNIGERINHGGGITLSEAEHMMATRLYQNTARVHFDARAQSQTSFGKRLIYGGHIIAHMRAMSFEGLQNAHCLAALNGGTHAAPAFAEDTIYGYSIILDKVAHKQRRDIGALRVRHIALKNRAPDDATGDFPLYQEPASDRRQYDPSVILDMDCWLWIARL